MKIVKFEEFNRMPKGTVFAPLMLNANISSVIDSVRFTDIEIKMDTGKNYDGRWYFNGVMTLQPDDYGDIFIYDGDTTDYSEYEEVLIFEPDDIRRVIAQLRYALGGCHDDAMLENHLLDTFAPCELWMDRE